MNKKINILFIIAFFLITILGCYGMIREPKEVSYLENRNLNTFEQFTINSFLNGEYQNNLENALSDQFIGSESIKIMMNKYLNITNFNSIKNNLCKDTYLSLGYNYYSYNCNEAVVNKPILLTKELEESLVYKIKNYNKLNEYTDMYYYIIPTSKIYDFKTNTYTIDIVNLLTNNLEGNYHLSSLKFNNYNEYISFFYKTDHHWNYLGSYNGYIDIMNMMNINNNILKPTEEIIFNDINFIGSAGRQLRIDTYKDEFKAYKFSYPEHTTTINGETKEYGKQNQYFDNEYNKDKFTNHYGEFYGLDYAEVIYDYNHRGKENILILSNSFSNSINSLIASHFNKTYIIDLRYYQNTMGHKFNIKDYIKKNNISKTLVIMDYEYLESSGNILEVNYGI